MDPTIIAGGLKLIGGLFGRKKDKPMTPAQSIMSTATGVTEAAAASGINRLTLLGASNATAGAGINMGGGASPLASLSVLGDIVEENYGDDAMTRKKHNQLENELLALEVDRVRSLRAVAPERAVTGASLGPATALVHDGQVAKYSADDAEFVGPHQPVSVINGLNGKWMTIPYGTAKRLRISAGETFIGGDSEQLLGEIAGEVFSTGSVATGIVNGDDPISDGRPAPPGPRKEQYLKEMSDMWPKRSWRRNSLNGPVQGIEFIN